MKRLIYVLLFVCMAVPSLAQHTREAEAYAYGNYLGTVSVDDLTTDGQVIFLQGIQVWPELKDGPDKQVPAVEERSRQIDALMHQVIDEQIRRQREQQSKADIIPALLDIFNSSDLVTSAKLDPTMNCIEIYWIDDPYPEYFEISESSDRPTWQERLNNEMEVLQIYIQSNYTMVIGSGIRQGLPPHKREEVHAEIAAVQNGSWNGEGLLDPRAARQFLSPMELTH